MARLLARLIAKYGPALAAVILERILHGQMPDPTESDSEIPYPDEQLRLPDLPNAEEEFAGDPWAEEIRYERATTMSRRHCCKPRMPRGCYSME